MKHTLLTSTFCLYLIWLVLEGPMKFRSSTATHNEQSSRDKPIEKRHKERRGLLYISTTGSTFLGYCYRSLWLTSFNCILGTIHVCPMISDDATQADISFFFRLRWLFHKFSGNHRFSGRPFHHHRFEWYPSHSKYYQFVSPNQKKKNPILLKQCWQYY